MSNIKSGSICQVVHLFGQFDPDEKNWTGEIQGTALVSKQILLSNLQVGGLMLNWLT